MIYRSSTNTEFSHVGGRIGFAPGKHLYRTVDYGRDYLKVLVDGQIMSFSVPEDEMTRVIDERKAEREKHRNYVWDD